MPYAPSGSNRNRRRRRRYITGKNWLNSMFKERQSNCVYKKFLVNLLVSALIGTCYLLQIKKLVYFEKRQAFLERLMIVLYFPQSFQANGGYDSFLTVFSSTHPS
jgi:hypothetical protein